MKLKVSRILHAGYIFECADTKIAFDPIFENPFSRNCHAFPNVSFDQEKIKKLRLDAVFISHFHDDHCSLESLDLLDRGTPIYMFCVFPELFAMIRELGFTKVYSLNLNEPIKIGAFEVIPRAALDVDVDSIFHIKAAGLKVLNVVDSWIDEDTLNILGASAPWDLVLWPFQTMREIEVLSPSRVARVAPELPYEWFPQLQLLNPRYVISSSCQFVQESWSWYNHALFPISYAHFKNEIEKFLPHAQVMRLNPSVSFYLDKESLTEAQPLDWVRPIGEQDVDYEFKMDLVPPTTAEIAKQFTRLTLAQTERVYDYCKRGLLEKFRSMDAPEDLYFAKPRFWRLGVYDHTGLAQNFFYRLSGAQIELANEGDEVLAWSTEVPIAKLYAALAYGEALTSMYMRINDNVFTPEIENEIAAVDIVEDPLIRCLFNGAFGNYQRAQLNRLLAR